MSKYEPIMERMKSHYENRSRTFLNRRTPVVCRIDGKTFHTYTKSLNKPFDEGLIEDMQKTAVYLCENIQGAKCAYTQSDEISILITDYDTLQTDAWFDYNVQKMTSISASLATGKFNQLRTKRNYYNQSEPKGNEFLHELEPVWSLANFDSRVFNIPKEEVANYFLARQKDAVKNSISMLAQSLYSHKELNGKNGDEMQEMSFQKGYNWNDLDFSKKRGSFIIKNIYINDKLSLEKSTSDLKIGDIWYQPDNISLFESTKSEHKGRLLEWNKVDDYEDWVDIKIEKIRNKWEVVETPMKFNETNFKKWL